MVPHGKPGSFRARAVERCRISMNVASLGFEVLQGHPWVLSAIHETSTISAQLLVAQGRAGMVSAAPGGGMCLKDYMLDMHY